MEHQQHNNHTKRIPHLLKYGTDAIAYLGLGIVSVLCTAALCFTVIFPTTYAETPQFSPKRSFIASTLTVLILIAWRQCRSIQLPDVSSNIVIRYVTAYAFITGALWSVVANLHPVSDQQAVTWYGQQLAQHHSERFSDLYIQQYPHQLGYVLFYAGFGSLFGFSNWTAIRLFNAALAAVALGTLCKLTEAMFESQRVVLICGALCMAFLPFIFFSNFVYGNIPSVACCLLACLMQQKALKSKRTIQIARYGAFCAICLGFGIWFKPNGLIFLIGIEIMWVVCTIITHRIVHLVSAIACAVLYVLASTLPTAIVEAYTQVSFDHATPKIAWIAMGMQDSPLAPGWYNSYVTEVYTEAHGDTKTIESLSKDAIRERMSFFLHHPQEAVQFFTRKEITQWTDPSFESLWTVFGGVEDEDLSKDSLLQQSFRVGKLRDLYTLWCDIAQSIIYIGATIALFIRRKTWHPEQLALLIIFLGGFAFHTIWEAKSDYVLPYFLLLIPYAAAGLSQNSQSISTIPHSKI